MLKLVADERLNRIMILNKEEIPEAIVNMNENNKIIIDILHNKDFLVNSYTYEEFKKLEHSIDMA